MEKNLKEEISFTVNCNCSHLSISEINTRIFQFLIVNNYQKGNSYFKKGHFFSNFITSSPDKLFSYFLIDSFCKDKIELTLYIKTNSQIVSEEFICYWDQFIISFQNYLIDKTPFQETNKILLTNFKKTNKKNIRHFIISIIIIVLLVCIPIILFFVFLHFLDKLIGKQIIQHIFIGVVFLYTIYEFFKWIYQKLK